MTVGRFSLVLHSHMPYVLSHGKSPHGTDWIFESAAECYLPILNVLDRLEKENVYPKWTINITPILAEQLEDEDFKSGFEEYCLEQIDIAKSDQKNFRKDSALWMEGISSLWQRYYKRSLTEFHEKWNRSICGGFKYFQQKGLIEIITSAATHGYLPLLSTEESVHAQVRIGKEVYKKHFGTDPRGFWLPECAYRPAYLWNAPIEDGVQPYQRWGIDHFLASENIEYFFVDSHMIKGGAPLGTYGALFPGLQKLFKQGREKFTPPPELRSEYEHFVLPSGVSCFARDSHSTVRVWSSEAGYPGTPEYLEFHKKLFPGRLRYWRVSEEKGDLGLKKPYDPWNAFQKIYEQACDFVDALKLNLSEYKHQSGEVGTLVSMYDTELFGHWWWEGPEFLYEVARKMHSDASIECKTCSENIDQHPTTREISLPEGSWGEGGYHYIWLNEDNVWTWKELYPLQVKFKNIVYQLRDKNVDTTLERILNQCGRELLLAESSDWQFLISTKSARDYAEVRFSDHVIRLKKLLDMITEFLDNQDVSVENLDYLSECEKKDSPFQELSYKMWSEFDNLQSGECTKSS